MTISHLHHKTVLVLNRHWLAIGSITPADAFCHLVGGTADALLISDAEGIVRHDWNSWRDLATDGSTAIGTTNGPVRVPTVLVLHRYDGVPRHCPRFGFRALWQRDGGRCQYTGRTLCPTEADIDHIVPRSRGGRDSWENCVISDRRVNRSKGAKTPQEAGLALIRKPRAPQAVPITITIVNTYQINDWNHFLMK